MPPGGLADLSDAAAEPDLPGEGRDHKERVEQLTRRLQDLQQALYAEGRRALLVILQARDAGGKDSVIRRVFGPLNPQGCTVTSFRKPTEPELRHDFLWRIHQAVPPRGFIGIFNRSHYEDVLVVRVHGLVPREEWSGRYGQINDFERMLTENGTTVVKLLLHVSRKEQAKRLRERLDDPRKNWKFNPEDLDERRRWDEYTEAYQEALARCSTPWAPWYVVPANRKPARDLLVADLLAHTLEAMDPRFPRADPDVLRKAREWE